MNAFEEFKLTNLNCIRRSPSVVLTTISVNYRFGLGIGLGTSLFRHASLRKIKI